MHLPSLVKLLVCAPFIQQLCSANFTCPDAEHSLRYEKVLGIAPRSKGLVLRPNNNKNSTDPITEACLDQCRDDVECVSFVLNYSENDCYVYRQEQESDDASDYVFDANLAWFRKVCYVGVGAQCAKRWVFERIPGAILIGNNTRKFPDALTRHECQQACLRETGFPCKSAKFRVTNERTKSDERKGICTLSDTNRQIKSNAYRVSSYFDEYFENQCASEKRNEFCSYEEFFDVRLRHADAKISNVTKENCEALCDNSTQLPCRSYSILRESQGQFACYLQSEDSKVHGPKLLQQTQGAKYYERAPCLNITVNCTDKLITIQFQPEYKYTGHMYMQGYSEQPGCYASGSGYGPVVLRIPLVEYKCGIIKAHNTLNDTLFTSTMLIQYNALLQTQADRVIKIGCIFGNENKILLGTGFNFSQESGTTGGSISIHNPNSAHPKVELKIIDLGSQNEVSDTQIGQELQFIIAIPNDGVYDIWAGHLVAMTENGEDSILLLDDRGCPTNLDVFPPLSKLITNSTIQLISTFQAFKFSTSNIIRFSVVVQFCMQECPEVDCGTINNIRKRDVESISSSAISEVNLTDFVSIGKQKPVIEEMPLELIIIVRNAKTTGSDRLVQGANNRQILVAGYDYSTNEVCIDYTVVIVLVITWVLIQLIFFATAVAVVRKYKKEYTGRALLINDALKENIEFSENENRRVHFSQ